MKRNSSRSSRVLLARSPFLFRCSPHAPPPPPTRTNARRTAARSAGGCSHECRRCHLCAGLVQLNHVEKLSRLMRSFAPPLASASRCCTARRCRMALLLAPPAPPAPPSLLGARAATRRASSVAQPRRTALCAAAPPLSCVEALPASPAAQLLAQLAELDPATAATASSVLAPLLNVGELLFIVRIVMTWYPNIKDDAFPWSLVYAPTEPLLSPTRKLITPVGRAALKNATPGDDD